MKKLLLVDGNSVLFRAYYATAYGARMTTSKGVPTNAVFGFANMMQKAIDLVSPDSIFVAFDAGKHTFRHELFQDYKGGRKPAPDDLVPQFGLARDYLDGYHIFWKEMKDIEADDLIGTLSKLSTDTQTTILTSDHDLLQLVDDHTTVLLMKKGLSEMDEMTPEKIQETMGITPIQIIDLKGLMGDTSDNYPGIPGVGEKTAVKLLTQYGSVENVLAHDQEIKGALGKKVQENHESALLSKKLATIKRDVEIDFTLEDCEFKPDYENLIRYFEALDMKSLARKYGEYVTTKESGTSEITFEHVHQVPKELLKDNISIYLDEDRLSFWQTELRGIALSDGIKSIYIETEDIKKDGELLNFLKSEKHKIGFDIKRALHILDRYEIQVNFSEDAMISSSLADSTLTSVDKIFTAFGLSTSETYEDIFGTLARPKMPLFDQVVRFACENAKNIYELYQESYEKLQQYDMVKLYREIELPLTFILKEMEETGIVCDRDILEQMSAQLKSELNTLQNSIYTEAGKEFNINSPKQLAEVLYDDLGLPSGKKRSTSADVLEKLAGVHPMIDSILSYRKLQKINSTYAEGLQKYINTDGKIHTIYNQCATQTGRLSSSEPNLQNISVRDELGKEVRKAFLPSEGNVLISCDYHQIELRILASMAQVPSMIDAFQNNIDVHTKTAMDLFNVERVEDVTATQRRRAKTVNFGIVYGISDFGLAEQLGVSRKEAGEFISTYYEKYPGIRSYMDSVVKQCEKDGYVTTLCGRRREIPEIKDKSFMVREFGKRAAMNAPIQGSAADLIKIAMIHIDEAMKKAGVKSKMILQVHDELIFDVPNDEVEQMKQLIEDGMIHAMEFDVPLTVECNVGADWYQAK